MMCHQQASGVDWEAPHSRRASRSQQYRRTPNAMPPDLLLISGATSASAEYHPGAASYAGSSCRSCRGYTVARTRYRHGMLGQASRGDQES